jgi:hypothetical protein
MRLYRHTGMLAGRECQIQSSCSGKNMLKASISEHKLLKLVAIQRVIVLENKAERGNTQSHYVAIDLVERGRKTHILLYMEEYW